VAARKRLAILVAALSPLIVRALVLPWFPVPNPRVHDEFSFLLAADTLMHGRLANPQHPFWVHFESMHILTEPVYASAFPIGQAAALAFGKVLFGHVWAGVWLSSGLMCGAICWMLQGWVPPRWALLGALLVVLRIGISSYWMNSYWGGCVPAIGGALVLGAVPRMMRAPRWLHAVVMGIGLAILANSRPFEGAVFGLAIAVPLFIWMLGAQRPPRGVALRQIVLPLALVLAVTVSGMAYYCARVTGKPWLAPYVLYRSTKTVAPHFIWQRPRSVPLFNNAEMRNFYLYDEMHSYLAVRGSPLEDLAEKAAVYWRFYFGPFLTVPLLALPFLWRDPRARLALLLAAGFSLALVGQVWHNAHYAAPATGLAILIVVFGMRRLQLWRWRKRPVGMYLVRSLPVLCAVTLAIQASAPTAETMQSAWRWPAQVGVKRASILGQLERSGDKNLVFVRYETVRHDTGDEWVYNDADIDGSPVVWARELDRESNAKLMRYFAGRRVWLVEPDAAVPRLVPYENAPYRPMPFVQLGAPDIEVLRSAEQVKSRVLTAAKAQPDTRFRCDAWNYFFEQSTGVAAPNATEACWGRDRAQAVDFEHWFEWMRGQR
jgi:hypothetical protein